MHISEVTLQLRPWWPDHEFKESRAYSDNNDEVNPARYPLFGFLAHAHSSRRNLFFAFQVEKHRKELPLGKLSHVNIALLLFATTTSCLQMLALAQAWRWNRDWNQGWISFGYWEKEHTFKRCVCHKWCTTMRQFPGNFDFLGIHRREEESLRIKVRFMTLKPGGIKNNLPYLCCYQNCTQHIKVCIPLKAYYSRSQFKSIFGLGHLQFRNRFDFDKHQNNLICID